MFYTVEVTGPAQANEAIRALSKKFKDFQPIGGKAVAAKLTAAQVKSARKLVATLNKDLNLKLQIKVTTC